MRICFINAFELSVPPFLLGFLILLSSTTVFADESRQRRFYFGADLGMAYMDLKRSDTNYSDTWLYGALRVEYALSSQLRLGVEGAGWTDQITSRSSISEDVTTLMMTARTYPFQNPNIFVRAGWGYAKHRYWESSESSDASGTAYLIGLGYDVYGAPLSISYSSGNLERETYNALTLSLGYTF